METIIIIAIAAALDIALGDPPNAFHPVAWMGRVISLLEKVGLKLRSPAPQFIYGALMTLFITALFVVPVFFLFRYLADVHIIIRIIVTAILLKSTFSIRGLRRAALKVKRLLENEKLDETRFELRALVSRDTSSLSRPLLVSAAVESVGEGTGDSLVAPLFYFLFLGVPGAIGYRVVNTLDAMIGYHGKYEYLGKFAARLDDVLNFIPARLAALLLVLAAILKGNGKNAWRTAFREHAKTESPNAGWPMSAMAGALGVRLEKPGHYILDGGARTLVPDTIVGAVNIFSVASTLWIMICFIKGGVEIAFPA